MAHDPRDIPPDSPSPPSREGAFDLQMAIPDAYVEGPRRIRSIVKRNGAVADYDEGKIAAAILASARSVGGEDADRARSLARAVSLHLSNELSDTVPSADEVSLAVERVLIGMGHVRTALAFVRHRDQHLRRRRIMGDGPDLLGAWGRLREGHAVLDTETPEPLVRTSDEQMAAWDPERIVAALNRETGLDESIAREIALEVEAQLRDRETVALTSALIREMVGARLIERGLDAYYWRQARLGVPLFDAERIICTPYEHGRGVIDPESTNSVLAERVKREFALSQVFSPTVADAHLWGDLHLHDAGEVDRLDSLCQPLERIVRVGDAYRGGIGSASAVRYDSMLAQMLSFTSALERHVSGRVGWDGVNLSLAPLLDDLANDDLAMVMHDLAHLFAYRAGSVGSLAAPVELHLRWSVPAHLHDAEPLGTDRDGGATGFERYLHTAQRIAWELCEAYAGSAGEDAAEDAEVRAAAPGLVFDFGDEFFSAPGQDRFLHQLGRVVTAWGGLRLHYDRDSPLLPFTDDPFRHRDVVAHRVSINLGRAAYRSKSDEAFFRELDRLTERAVEAHLCKRRFLERLMALKKAGPLGLLTEPTASGAFVKLEEGTWLVGIAGLNECVRILRGAEMHQSNRALELAEQILAHLRARCAEWSADCGLHIVTAPTADEAVLQRFAAIDSEQFPVQAKAALPEAPFDGAPAYTPGTDVNRHAELTPMERIRLEGRLHPLLGYGAVTRLEAPDGDADPAAVAQLVVKAFRQTACGAIAFERTPEID